MAHEPTLSWKAGRWLFFLAVLTVDVLVLAGCVWAIKAIAAVLS